MNLIWIFAILVNTGYTSKYSYYLKILKKKKKIILKQIFSIFKGPNPQGFV